MATTGMVADLVRQVAGEHVVVESLMGAVDPHLFKPTPRDMIHLQAADLVFYSGLHLEGQMAHIFESQSGNSKFFAVTSGLSAEELLADEGSASHPDPHVWHDPLLWGKCALQVAEVLAVRLPEHRDEFFQNAERYQAELSRFDRFAAEVFQSVSPERRVLVTAHDAFRYFANRYGLEVEAIQGISTESEAGLFDVNRLVRLVVSRKIPSIFVETTVNESYVRQVVAAAREQGWPVQLGGTLYSDALGDPGTYAGTCLGMLDHNVATIASGLAAQREGPLSYRECLSGATPAALQPE